MAGEKAQKGQVHYRNGFGTKYCAVCTMYLKPNQCTAVQGYIAPHAYCDLFEKDTDKRSPSDA